MKQKKIKKVHFRWPLFLIGIAIGIVILGLFSDLRQKLFFRSHRLAKSDTLVNTYNPPGAKAPPVKSQETGILPVGERAIKVPILLYHYLEYNQDLKDTIRTSLSVTPFWFEKQLEDLRYNGYHTISFADLYTTIEKHSKLPQKPVILTFDDGYRDFYTDAFPLLKKYKAKATVFIIPGFLDKPNYLFDWQVKEIANDNTRLVTIGAHTMHHPALTSLDPQKAFEEILDSKKFLEKNYNQPVTVFNYPYGLFNNDVIDLVKKAKFQMAVSTILGDTQSLENIFILPRIRVGNYAGTIFEERLNIDRNINLPGEIK